MASCHARIVNGLYPSEALSDMLQSKDFWENVSKDLLNKDPDFSGLSSADLKPAFKLFFYKALQGGNVHKSPGANDKLVGLVGEEKAETRGLKI